MIFKKRLIAVTAFLLIFNVCLGGFAVFNQLRGRSNRNDSVLENVLGASTPIFSRHTIMSDETFSSTRAFPSEASVQAYLDSAQSPLRNYETNGKKASYWIYSSARGITSSKWGVTPQINPGVILAYLEKEQSLISLKNYDVYSDPQFRIRTAMGYGCPDGGSCADTYKGFANQVNWAAYQLQYNFNQAPGSGGGTQYRIGQTITTLDGYSVYMSNAATAAQYRYTPHVYWGNYNLWKIIHGNGWGTDTQTYSLSDIDAVNLPNKGDKDFDPIDGTTIDQADIEDLLVQDFTLGTQNDDIKRLQTFLKEQGYFTYPSITGLYGVVTDSALKNYRRDKAINTGFSEESDDRCTQLIQSDWALGIRNQEVVDLQNCLIELGLFNYPQATGYFGPITEASLEAAKKSLEKEQNTGELSCDELKGQRWKIGERNDDVRSLQQCLSDEGYYTWPYGITGYYGPYTEEKLADSLNNSPIENSDDSGPETLSACDQLLQQSWSLGQQGDDVKELQDCLTDSGHFNYQYGSTGYFGTVTQSALDAAKNTNQEPATPVSNCQNLYNQSWTLGQTGSQVRALQECLQADGFYDWPNGITEYFGPYTEGALSRAGGSASSGQSNDFSCSSLKQQTWIIGERSTRVKTLQECMQSAGVFNYQYGATGYFGEVTKQALIQWRGYF